MLYLIKLFIISSFIWAKLILVSILKIRTLGLLLFLACFGCSSIQRTAVKQIGKSLANEKTMEVIVSDDDPELVWDAMPFALKTMEVMLAQDPTNTDLLLGLASAYIQYAHGHLGTEAQKLENADYNKSMHLWKRTHKLSLRGRDYALNALESRHPGFKKGIIENTESTLSETTIDDVPFLYWAAVGWAGAVSADKNDMDNIAELPVAGAIMNRVLELDESYNDGAAHEFLIAYEGSRPELSGAGDKKAKEHFDKAVEYTKGKKAYPYVVYAETVAVKQQNLQLFNKLINEALEVDVDGVKRWRLSNTIAHEHALWLKDQIPELFIDYTEEQ